MQTPLFTFKKGEKLRKKQDLDTLFLSKDGFIIYPFRVVYCQLHYKEEEIPAKVLISIPKRRIKKAVQRNLLKRRTREAYRLKKHELYQNIDTENHTLAIGLLYIGNKVVSYREIDNAIDEIIRELRKRS